MSRVSICALCRDTVNVYNEEGLALEAQDAWQGVTALLNKLQKANVESTFYWILRRRLRTNLNISDDKSSSD